MIHLACEIPQRVVVAVSGGPDSMALLDFCRRGRRELTALYVNHGTPLADRSEILVREYCRDMSIPFERRKVRDGSSGEEEWRDERLQFYREFTAQGEWIATAHHLDDVVEWYILSALHGNPRLMNRMDARHRLLKPFLYATKQSLLERCQRFDVPYVVDPTNIGSDNARAILRSQVMPSLLQIHPGMRSSILTKMMMTGE